MTEQDEKNEVQYSDEEKESAFGRIISALVVLVTVVGFFSFAWYAYKNGDEATDEKDIEVVKADPTPVKETPANPGGMQIPNQDKTVYGLVNGNKGEKPPVERILPAPEEPMAHGSDTETWMSDKAKKIANGEEPQDTSKQVAIQEPSNTPTAADAAATPQPEVKKTEQFTPDKAHVEADQAKQAAAALTPTAPAAITAPAPVPAVVPTPSAPVVVADATPQPAPAAPKPLVSAPEVKKPAPAVSTPKPAAEDADDNSDDEAATPVAAVSPPKGARVQLGAYKSEAEANQNWAKIAKAFAGDVQGKQHYVVRADLGDKGVFYRLQVAPFDSPKAAEEFCINFVSAGQGCFLAKGK